MNRKPIEKTVLSAMFLSLGIVLPMLTGQIKEIGDTLLPMHLPVMLCGFFCGPIYGGAVGLLTPLLKWLITDIPPLYPNAIWMAAELLTYGVCTGLFYKLFRKFKFWGIYMSLIPSMLIGRIVWGIVKAVLLGIENESFTLKAFFLGGFADAAVGIVLQLILIPVIVKTLEKE